MKQKKYIVRNCGVLFIALIALVSCEQAESLPQRTHSENAEQLPTEQETKQAENEEAKERIDYGVELPGDTPELFKPGTVSTDLMEYGFSFSPHGDEFIFSREGAVWLCEFDKESHTWKTPEIAPFSDLSINAEASYTPDGNRIVFSSRRALPQSGRASNLWYSVKADGIWQAAEPFPAPVNDQDMHAACVAENGNIYASGLLVVPFVDGAYLPAQPLSPEIKGYRLYVDPQERFILFDNKIARGRDSNLYLAKREPDGSWGTPVLLNSHINSERSEVNPTPSPDGKLLFFGRDGDIWWVKIDFLDEYH